MPIPYCGAREKGSAGTDLACSRRHLTAGRWHVPCMEFLSSRQTFARRLARGLHGPCKGRASVRRRIVAWLLHASCKDRAVSLGMIFATRARARGSSSSGLSILNLNGSCPGRNKPDKRLDKGFSVCSNAQQGGTVSPPSNEPGVTHGRLPAYCLHRRRLVHRPRRVPHAARLWGVAVNAYRVVCLYTARVLWSGLASSERNAMHRARKAGVPAYAYNAVAVSP